MKWFSRGERYARGQGQSSQAGYLPFVRTLSHARISYLASQNPIYLLDDTSRLCVSWDEKYLCQKIIDAQLRWNIRVRVLDLRSGTFEAPGRIRNASVQHRSDAAGGDNYADVCLVWSKRGGRAKACGVQGSIPSLQLTRASLAVARACS